MTLEEYQATAQLLGDGWYYDQSDHTYCHTINGPVIDADTMDDLGDMRSTYTGYMKRCKMVTEGKIGCLKKPL